MRELLTEEAGRLGFDLVGVCDAVPAPHLQEYESWLRKGYHGTMQYLADQLPLKAKPQELLPECRSIVAVGLNYYQPVEHKPGEMRIAKYALGRDYHKVLRGRLKKLADWMSEQWPDQETRVCVDSAPILERDYAQRAGLGWFGKNTCLINTKQGSWFFIGLILTTAVLEPSAPAEGGCGTCTACIDTCPTGAIVFEDERWQVRGDRCISYLTIEHRGEIEPELAKMMGDWTFGCDVCQDVCPFNKPREHQPKRSAMTEEEDFLRQRDWPSLKEAASMSYEQWDELTAGSPVRRAGFEGLKRNALLNLKNEG